MTWQLATAKIWNGTQWVNAAGGADIYAATDGTDAPYSTANVTVTASATPHTKGAWIEMIASTAFAANRLVVTCGSNNSSGANSSSLLDIGVGAAGAEVVKIENVAVGYTRNGIILDFPIQIPSGSRIAARMQSAIVSRNMTVNAAICRTAKTLTVNPSGIVNTFGADTSTSRGVTVTSGNNVKGSWTQITANSGSAAKYLYVEMQGNGSAAMGTNAMLADIGIGAAGAETVVVPNIRFSTNSAELIDFTSLFRGYFVSIPASTRIAIRTQATGATIPLDFIVHTVNEVGSQ